jgi:pimeloyl-ACP methyl ester carboxylesterase
LHEASIFDQDVTMADTALFLHSTGTGPFMWKRLMGSVPEGMTAVTPVNRGYAPGDQMARGTPFEIGMDVAHVKAQIPDDTTGLHLVAHSYGGLLALHLALDESLPVKSLWLYEPVLFGSLRRIQDQLTGDVATEVSGLYDEPRFLADPEHGGNDAWLERFIDYWSAPGMWAAMPDKVKDMSRAVGWKMYSEVNAQATLFRPIEDYRLSVPVTLVHGEHSPAPARDMAQRLAELNPQAHLQSLVGLGHMSVITQADQVLPSLQAHWQRTQSA